MHHEHPHQQPGARGAAMPPNERHTLLHQTQESAEAPNSTAPHDLRIGNMVIPGVRLRPANVIAPANVMSGYYGAPPPPSLKAGGSIGGGRLPNDGVEGSVGGGGGACPPPTMPLKRFVTPEDDDITAAARAALGGPRAATDTSLPGLKKSPFDFSAGPTAVPFHGDRIIGGSLMSIPEDVDFSRSTGGSGKSCPPILPISNKFDHADVKMDTGGGANSFLPPHIRQLLRQQQPQPQALTHPLPPIPCGQKKQEEHKPASPSLVSDYLTGKLDTQANAVQPPSSGPGQSGPKKRKRPDDDPEDRPLVRGEDVHDNDVLCGRGGGTNHNVGNKRYRDLVRYYQPLYVVVPKREKLRVSKGIVSAVRHATPPGRFLERVEDAKPSSGGSRGEAEERYAGSALYRDIGDRRAWDKTSQTLREGAPEIRKNAEIEKAVAAARIGCGSWVTHLQAAVRRQDEKEAEKGRRPVTGGRGTGTEAAALHTAALLGSAGGKERQEEDRDAVAARGVAAAKATAMAATLVRRDEEALLRRQQQQLLADAGSISTLAIPSGHLTASSLMDSQNQALAAAVAQAAAAAGSKASANNLNSAYLHSLVGGTQTQLGSYHSSNPFGVPPGTTTAASLTDKSVLERYIAGSVIANPPQLIRSESVSSSAGTVPLASVSLSGHSMAGDFPGPPRLVSDPQSKAKIQLTDLPLEKAIKAGAATVPNASGTGGDRTTSTRGDQGAKSRILKERRPSAGPKAQAKEAPRRSSVPLPKATLSRRGNGRRSSLPSVVVDRSPAAGDNKERASDGPKASNGKVVGLSPSDALKRGDKLSATDVVPKVSRRRSSSKRIYEEQIKAAQAYIKHLTSLQQEQEEIEDEEQAGSDASGTSEGCNGSDEDGLGDRETTRQLSTADVALSRKSKSHRQISSLEKIASSAMAAYREQKASSQLNLSGGGPDIEPADSGTGCPSLARGATSYSSARKEMFGNRPAITLNRAVETVDEKDGSVMPASQEQFSSLMQLSQVAFALGEGRDKTSGGGQTTEDSPKAKCEERVVGKRTPPLPLKKRLRSVEAMAPREPTSLYEGPKMPSLPQTVLLRRREDVHNYVLNGGEIGDGHVVNGHRNGKQHDDGGNDIEYNNYMRTNKGQPERAQGKGPNLSSDNLGGGVDGRPVREHQGMQKYENDNAFTANLDAVTTSSQRGVDPAAAGGGGITNQKPVVGPLNDKKTRQDAILKALFASSGKVGLNEAANAKLTSFPGVTSDEAGTRAESHPDASHIPLSLVNQVDLLRRLQMCASAGSDLLPRELFSSSQTTGTAMDVPYNDLSSTAGAQSQSEDQFAWLLQQALRQQRDSTLDALSSHLGGRLSKGPLP